LQWFKYSHVLSFLSKQIILEYYNLCVDVENI
jgi:hypothetical protein